MNDSATLCRDALWTNNAGLVQLLGLCPLLAVTTTFVNGLGLGLATTLTLVLSSTMVSVIRPWLRPEIRIPAFVLIIACSVTVIELVMSARYYGLYTRLGIFIPLIVTNCTIIARAEVFASRNSPPRAALDGLMTGIGFAVVLASVGAIRELAGRGTLFAQAQLLFGEQAAGWTLTLTADYPGFLLAILPPGAFFVLALLIAIKNSIDAAARNHRAVVAKTQYE